MTCEEFEELSGAYALGAVTPEEWEAARAHLAGCANCTRHLQELRAVVDLLPYSVTQVNPPESLKGRLLKAIRREITATPTQPVPMNRRPQRRRRATQLLAVAAVLALMLFAGMTAWNVSLQQQHNSLEHQVTSLQQQNITRLVMERLPRLQVTQVYQGWLIHGKQPTSIGLLSVENGIASVTYPGNITGYEVAAVSREP